MVIKDLQYIIVLDKPTPTMSNPESLKIKERGNAHFHEHNYKEALKCYTQAIQIDPNNSILFSNRARCFKLLSNLFEANQDAQRALSIDPHNIKAQLLSGEILLDIANEEKDIQKIKVAIQKLKKSLSMSVGIKEFQASLQEKIYRAKKNLWEANLKHEVERKRALKSYMIKIIESDPKLSDETKDIYNEKIQELLDFNIRTQKFTVPKELVCEVSGQVMKDPVCNEHGYTYCKKPYLSYVETHKIDPKTKKPIANISNIFPNVSLRKAISQFLDKNIWAYEENAPH